MLRHYKKLLPAASFRNLSTTGNLERSVPQNTEEPSNEIIDEQDTNQPLHNLNGATYKYLTSKYGKKKAVQMHERAKELHQHRGKAHYG